MCGITGYIHSHGLFAPSVLDRMLAAVKHRGPDGEDAWTQPSQGVAFAHARLKVQDLSNAARQPMHTADGSATLVYNGEIYNFRELRDELRAAGATFKSTGDTEVLLELCRRDPELSFLPKLNGMFAFALWHGPTKTLSLARDRTGVKPMLYAPLGSSGLAFASEMAALRHVVPDVTIDPQAVMELLSLGFIAAPRSIFSQVRKLRPGHLLRYHGGRLRVEPWCIGPATRGEHAPVSDFTEACRRLRDTFTSAVTQRLVADVPVGIFLSGGIDSAIVTATAAQAAGTRIKTFSVSFPDNPFYDESRYARAVADMYGTDHTVLPLSLDEVLEVIPAVQSHLGEPFADSSALPTYLLSRLTREHVTVALSGDGADELFAGYNRYAATRVIERFGWLARTPLYRPMRRLIERLPTKRERRIGSLTSQLKRAIRSIDSRLPHRYANWMRTSDDRTFARLLHEPEACGGIVEDIVDLLWRHRGEPKHENDLNHHLRTEWALSLPDDMLTKVDLMSMAHGLEVRSPFLDPRVVDQVFPLDWRWKLAGWKKKHMLVEAYKDDLPALLHNRPKKGFEVPVGPWLRGPLNEMARDLIANDDCFFGRILSREGARKTLEEHTSGRADHNFCLWALVSLLAWQQQHAPGVRVSSD